MPVTQPRDEDVGQVPLLAFDEHPVSNNSQSHCTMSLINILSRSGFSANFQAQHLISNMT